jgi:hypothetical protein
MARTYFEEQFIREGARKLELEAHSRHLETIRIVLGEEAFEEELLSDKPIHLSGVVVRDPRNELNHF